MMLDKFTNKQFIPVVAMALAILFVLWMRPAFFVQRKSNKKCPLCICPLRTTIFVFLVGAVAYYFVH